MGTAGHVDHGKTTLVRALTGTDTDRWKEEQERGLTIDIGFARLDLDPALEISVIDVPGHEDFIKNMLAGATGIDVLLLVVAADEGPMPQTHEHVAIARLLGVRRGVVALTKSDRVDEEWLALAQETTQDVVAEVMPEATWDVIPVSSVTGDGLDELRAALARCVADASKEQQEDLFRLPVDRSFSIRGTGTVVTGTVWSGSISVGETVRILDSGESARVRGLHVHDEPRLMVSAGRRCAVALVGKPASALARGSVLVTDPGWNPSSQMGARLHAIGGRNRALEHGQRVRVYLGTREVMARLYMMDRAPLHPGQTTWVVMALEAPLLARVGDRAVIRFYSPVTTIGGAEVADLDPPPDWWRCTQEWTAVLDGSAADALRATAEIAGMQGVAEKTAPITLGRTAAEIRSSAEETGCLKIGDRWFAPPAIERAREEVLRSLNRLHAAHRRSTGVSKEAVRSTLANAIHPLLVQTTMERMLAAGELQARGPLVSLSGHRVQLTGSEATALERLSAAISQGGLQPPTVSDLEKALRLDRVLLDDLLRLILEQGTATAVTAEIYLAHEHLDALEARVRDMLADGRIGPPGLFKRELGLSRKYLIPLLEYLDRKGVTRRLPEGRSLVS